MPLCVKPVGPLKSGLNAVTADGVPVASSLVLDAPDASGACPGYVLLSGLEHQQQAAQLANVPTGPTALTLTAEQGGYVSSAIAGVWFVAWAFRRFVQVLNIGDE